MQDRSPQLFQSHQQRSEKIAEDVLRSIESKDSKARERLHTWRIFSALFIKQDVVLLAALRNKLRKALAEIANRNDLTDDNKLSLIFNYLNWLPYTFDHRDRLLPYADNKLSDEMYKIPVMNEAKEWTLVDYAVDAIELTPTWGPQSFVMNEKQRAFAYGFRPLIAATDTLNSLAHLVYVQPYFPTMQGFSSLAFSRSFPVADAWLYHTGKSGLKSWVNDVTQGNNGIIVKAHGCGLHPLVSHTPQAGVQYVMNSAQKEQLWWHALTENLFLRSILFAAFSLPLYFVALPLVRAILQHKTELLIVAAMTMTFVTFPGLLLNPLGLAATIAASLYVGSKLFGPFKRLVGLNDICHPQDESMQQEDLSNTGTYNGSRV